MSDFKLSEVIERSKKIREKYHELEITHHGSKWTVEEDALAFLTDAALVGRLTMSQQRRWPNGGETQPELEHKIGECMWWLTILANRMDLDINDALKQFLTKTETLLQLTGDSH
jgi:NTP pyrophosphatase (non-canonical NTP hydrolase)